MATSGKKISEQTLATSLDGNELFPFAKNGADGVVKASKIKDYVQPDLSGYVPKENGKGLSSNDYTNEEKQKLSALPTMSGLEADIDSAEKAMIVAQWNAACGSHGLYDPTNAPDTNHPFKCNGIWMTFTEAAHILTQYTIWGTDSMDYAWNSVRTNIPHPASARTYFNSFLNLEVLNMSKMYPRQLTNSIMGDTFKQILNFNAEYLSTSPTGSFQTANLEVLQLRKLKVSLDLNACKKIDLSSWQYLVTNAANTSAITVSVHADVYAKLTGDTTNAAAAALSASELAQWQQVATDAAAKQISFATTN